MYRQVDVRERWQARQQRRGGGRHHRRGKVQITQRVQELCGDQGLHERVGLARQGAVHGSSFQGDGYQACRQRSQKLGRTREVYVGLILVVANHQLDRLAEDHPLHALDGSTPPSARSVWAEGEVIRTCLK
jgi:hypothetical protein